MSDRNSRGYVAEDVDMTRVCGVAMGRVRSLSAFLTTVCEEGKILAKRIRRLASGDVHIDLQSYTSADGAYNETGKL